MRARSGLETRPVGEGAREVASRGGGARPLRHAASLGLVVLLLAPTAGQAQRSPSSAMGSGLGEGPASSARAVALPAPAPAKAASSSVATGGASSRVTSLSVPPAGASPAPTQGEAPWRLDSALGVPPWLHLGLEHRSRLEHLTDDFRAPTPTIASAWMLRTLGLVELRPAFLVATLELQDSRALATDTAALNTTHVNPLELLRASVGVRREGLFVPGDLASVTFGRQTIDLGSRRLLARNEFRNTINAFTGVHAEWAGSAGQGVRAFAVVPVRRAPSAVAELQQNVAALDVEDANALLWGLFVASGPLAERGRLEGYVLGLQEADAPGAPTSNRALVTPGARFVRRAVGTGVDVEVEGMLQAGSSRATKADGDQRTLQHLAVSLHASVGYRLAAPWSPRVLAAYDYASGDTDPDDGFNARFDPLFGARRFELGPTGLYGALSRTNLSSPALRLEVTPHRDVDAFLAVRVAWLASARDAWGAGELRDGSGAAGADLGEQLEGRVRWQLVPRNLALELGAASFTRGAFARNAPGGRRHPSLYVYTQLTGTL